LDQELEFDPIAFRCDFTEYENLKEIQDNYQDIKNIDDLKNNTTVIQVPNTKKIIIQNLLKLPNLSHNFKLTLIN
jgi:hypothetical protein